MLPVTTLGVMCSAPGQSFGVQPFKELFSTSLDLSRSEVSAAYMAGTLLAALPMTYIGWCMDRFGARRTLMIIVTLLMLACLLISQATGLFTLFLAFLLLRTFGQGSLTLLNFNTMAMWFHRRLGLVNALMSIGLAGAIAVVPTLNGAMIQQFGWRWAYALLGIGVWVTMFPLLVFVFRNRPEDGGQRPDNDAHPHPDEPEPAPERALTLKQAMRTRAYWIMLAMIGFWALASTGMVLCMGSVFQTRGLGLVDANAQAAQVMLAYGVTLAIVHLPVGLLVDRAPANRVLLAAALCMVVTFALFRFSPATGLMIYIIGLFYGLAQSLLMAVNATLWVRYFGRAHLGKIRGTVTTTMVASSAAGPLMLDLTNDLVGRYGPMVLAFAALPLVLAIASLFATPPRAEQTGDDDDHTPLDWDESESPVTDPAL
jgi:MFS family permease